MFSIWNSKVNLICRISWLLPRIIRPGKRSTTLCIILQIIGLLLNNQFIKVGRMTNTRKISNKQMQLVFLLTSRSYLEEQEEHKIKLGNFFILNIAKRNDFFFFSEISELVVWWRHRPDCWRVCLPSEHGLEQPGVGKETINWKIYHILTSLDIHSQSKAGFRTNRRF